MLSTTSDHAIRAVLVLARHYGQGPLRSDEIASAIGAPRNYLSKTLHWLSREGVVNSSRGPLGGFVLALPPEAITLAHIVDCFEEPRRQHKCLMGTSACDPASPCVAHHRWTEITEARRLPLSNTTVADLLRTNAATGASTAFTAVRPAVVPVA